MRFPFVRPLLFALAMMALLLALPTRAFAAAGDVTITLPIGTLQRRDGSGTAIDNPTTTGEPYTISNGNCKDNQSFDFAITVTGNLTNPAPVIQAWAGTGDCTDVNNRQGTQAQCWPVSPTYGPPNVSGGATTINVRVQDILSQLYTPTSSRNFTYVAAGSSVCTASQNTSVAVYILATEISTLRGSLAPLNFPIRVTGPSAPTLNSVQGGDGALVLNFTPPGDVSTTSTTDPETGTTSGSTTNLLSYTVYCSPQAAAATTPATIGAEQNPSICEPSANIFDSTPPTDAGVASTSGALTPADGDDAGDASDAADAADASDASNAADAGTAVGSDAGGSTATNAGWICKDHETIPAGSSTKARLEGFKNGYAYNIAIAANDIYGNTGTRSATLCGIPQPTYGFWDAYKAAGGAAGGGYCSVDGVGMPLGAGGTVLIVVSAALGLVRRRKVS